ncbi:nicotinate phosphoribosyltransferase, partial [Streptomyces sp. NRRL F-6602]
MSTAEPRNTAPEGRPARTGEDALRLPVEVPSTALFTDHYELTMLQAALAAGTADRPCVFEVFTRKLPEGRRYGVLAGVGRVLD